MENATGDPLLKDDAGPPSQNYVMHTDLGIPIYSRDFYIASYGDGNLGGGAGSRVCRVLKVNTVIKEGSLVRESLSVRWYLPPAELDGYGDKFGIVSEPYLRGMQEVVCTDKVGQIRPHDIHRGVFVFSEEEAAKQRFKLSGNKYAFFVRVRANLSYLPPSFVELEPVEHRAFSYDEQVQSFVGPNKLAFDAEQYLIRCFERMVGSGSSASRPTQYDRMFCPSVVWDDIFGDLSKFVAAKHDDRARRVRRRLLPDLSMRTDVEAVIVQSLEATTQPEFDAFRARFGKTFGMNLIGEFYPKQKEEKKNVREGMLLRVIGFQDAARVKNEYSELGVNEAARNGNRMYLRFDRGFSELLMTSSSTQVIIGNNAMSRTVVDYLKVDTTVDEAVWGLVEPDGSCSFRLGAQLPKGRRLIYDDEIWIVRRATRGGVEIQNKHHKELVETISIDEAIECLP